MRRYVARRERAQTVVIAALGMLALIGAAALAIDVGLVWESQRELQKTADSAALAGIILLPADPLGAEERAGWYALQNQGIAAVFCSDTPTTTATPGEHALASGGTVYTLTVTMQCTAGFTFARVLDNLPDCPTCFNLDTIPNTVDACGCLRASATAVIGSLRVATCPAPFAVSDANEGEAADGTPVYDGDPGVTWVDLARNGFGYDFGQLVELHVDTAGSSFGNFHALDFLNGTGASVYQGNLAGHCGSSLDVQPGDKLLTQPGDMTGPTEHGLEDRGLVSCSGASQPDLCTDTSYPSPHPRFSLACPDDPFDHNGHPGVLNGDGSVKRSSHCLAITVVVTPLAFTDSHGRSQVTVEGFAEFFIAGWDQSTKAVWGMFVSRAPSLGDVGAYNPLGTIVTRLIR